MPAIPIGTKVIVTAKRWGNDQHGNVGIVREHENVEFDPDDRPFVYRVEFLRRDNPFPMGGRIHRDMASWSNSYREGDLVAL